MRSPVALLLVLIAPLASALEEGRLRDVRVRGGVIPGSGTVHIETDFTGFPSFDEDVPGFDRGYRASIGFFESFRSIANPNGTVLLGLSISFSQLSVETNRFSGDGGLEADAISVDGHAGYALPLAKHIHLEALGFLGAGGMRVTDHTPSTILDPVTGLPIGTQDSNRSNGDGPYYEGGISGGAYYTFANGVQLGLDAGVLAFHASATVNWLNARSEYTFSGFGPFANLSLGLRF